MRYVGKHERKSAAWWALISWVLAVTFIAVSLFYASQGSVIACLVWMAIGLIWTYNAVGATVKHIS